MQTLRNDSIILINYDSQRSLLMTDWKPNQSELTADEIKEVLQSIGDYLLKYRPENYIADQTNKNSVYPVEIQNWIAKVLYTSCIKGGVKKAALVQSENFITSLSTTQMLEEASDMPVQFATFTSVDDAIEWMHI